MRDAVLWAGTKHGLDREDIVLDGQFCVLLITHNDLGVWRSLEEGSAQTAHESSSKHCSLACELKHSAMLLSMPRPGAAITGIISESLSSSQEELPT